MANFPIFLIQKRVFFICANLRERGFDVRTVTAVQYLELLEVVQDGNGGGTAPAVGRGQLGFLVGPEIGNELLDPLKRLVESRWHGGSECARQRGKAKAEIGKAESRNPCLQCFRFHVVRVFRG